MIYEWFAPEDPANQKTADRLDKHKKPGPKEFEEFHTLILQLVKEVGVINVVVEQGDWISAVVSFSTIDRKSENADLVTISGCVMVRIEDDKIREAHNFFDFLHFFEGLGLIPEDMFVKCLTGTVLFDNLIESTLFLMKFFSIKFKSTSLGILISTLPI